LQPSRIVPRKRIERTIKLVKELDLPNLVLLLAGYAGDEGLEYLQFIKQEIKSAKIKAIWASNRIGFERKIKEGQKIYRLWDAYVESDFVCLPSDIEGFGNHVIEALYFKKPLFVNNYPVYQTDIAPKGVRAVVINGNVTRSTVAQVKKLLSNPDLIQAMTAHNYQVGKKHFSEKILEEVLDQTFLKLKLQR